MYAVSEVTFHSCNLSRCKSNYVAMVITVIQFIIINKNYHIEVSPSVPVRGIPQCTR